MLEKFCKYIDFLIDFEIFVICQQGFHRFNDLSIDNSLYDDRVYQHHREI